MNLMDSKATWKDGQEVTGRYLGIEYRGKIVDGSDPYGSRRVPRGNGFIFVVDLLAPIVVFGQERTRIEIWTNSDNSIEAN